VKDFELPVARRWSGFRGGWPLRWISENASSVDPNFRKGPQIFVQGSSEEELRIV